MDNNNQPQPDLAQWQIELESSLQPVIENLVSTQNQMMSMQQQVQETDQKLVEFYQLVASWQEQGTISPKQMAELIAVLSKFKEIPQKKELQGYQIELINSSQTLKESLAKYQRMLTERLVSLEDSSNRTLEFINSLFDLKNLALTGVGIVVISTLTGIIGSRLLPPDPNAASLKQDFTVFSNRMTAIEKRLGIKSSRNRSRK